MCLNLKTICHFILLTTLFFCLSSCNQQNQTRNLAQKNDVDDTFEIPKKKDVAHNANWIPLSIITSDSSYKNLNDTLRADFNGDHYEDIAFYSKENNTSGITIIHGNTLEKIKIGYGNQFSIWDNFDCNWVDQWSIFKEKQVTENVFSDEGEPLESNNIVLQNTSIELHSYDQGGGLITYVNGQYIWIHHNC